MGCLEHLSICKAECCKVFSFNVEGARPEMFKRNRVVSFQVKGLSDDLVHYYKLHGCRVIRDVVFVHLDKFELRGDTLYVYNRCKALKANRCVLHGLDSQPLICGYPNEDGGRHMYIRCTDNCLFKKMYEEEYEDG